MRSFTLPIPTLLAGFVAVLVGYASSAAIIWQAAAAAGADAGQIAGWMTALGPAMGVSTLVLTLWRKVPILTAWSTPCAALLVSGLQGATLAQAVGIFVFRQRADPAMRRDGTVCPPHEDHSAFAGGGNAGGGSCCVFGLQAFGSLQDNLPLCGGMFAARLLCKSALPTFCGRCGVSGRRDHCPANRRAVASGKTIWFFCCSAVDYAAVHPFATAQRRCTVFFLVTMASQNAPGLATIQASGYRVPVSPLIVFTGALALLFSPFGVYSVCIAAITAAICQKPGCASGCG